MTFWRPPGISLYFHSLFKTPNVSNAVKLTAIIYFRRVNCTIYRIFSVIIFQFTTCYCFDAIYSSLCFLPLALYILFPFSIYCSMSSLETGCSPCRRWFGLKMQCATLPLLFFSKFYGHYFSGQKRETSLHNICINFFLLFSVKLWLSPLNFLWNIFLVLIWKWPNSPRVSLIVTIKSLHLAIFSWNSKVSQSALQCIFHTINLMFEKWVVLFDLIFKYTLVALTFFVG